MLCLLPNGIVVLLRPALLEPYNVWLRTGGGDLISYFGKALIAEFGNELKAPAIERQDAYTRRWWAEL